ncbi:predicted amidophosphoribosyltransferase [Chthonomonas calidirosea]|uniref:Predicted amidophosphoribosyltransferases n=1 Tax=Chthonomonas calidirosea (strain DSM 23976 / ICMP 18418 / T49) TaxID=1303518 RepID=S0EXL5_CHTCT|nr:ComF family protein [Chthonomonas calidirosea]CCW36230.1 Predicted amidophosphoribosyltransferases [Chthonomonas calidirosea T49]CEK17952.1 predicted amidophosphoribosyltransferase [Chthonomonas calidirosea]
MKVDVKAFAALCFHGLLDLVYPPKCLLCGTLLPEGALCTACIASFETLQPPFCVRCGAPTLKASSWCLQCAAGEVPAWDWSFAFGRYSGGLREAIHRLKYGGSTSLAAPLAHLLANAFHVGAIPEDALQIGNLAFDIVVPVPLHPKRLRQRGYNQSERIAFYFAKEKGWRLETRGLRRVRFAGPQTRLGAAARRENVVGAFEVTEPERFRGLSVVLVDDVITTGSTLGEIAKLLKQAGAARIWVLAVARD